MISSLTDNWTSAAIALGKDANAKIPCPRCGYEFLRAEDIFDRATPIERHVYCPSCGAENFLLYSRDQEKRDSSPSAHQSDHSDRT
jgi:predicted RNA-binding Zn-ribbon protein involved in translation (DUF1610 family)